MRVPIGCGPIEGFSFFDNFVKSSADFFKGSLLVVKVGVQDIDIFHLQSLETFVDALFDVLSVERNSRINVRVLGR